MRQSKKRGLVFFIVGVATITLAIFIFLHFQNKKIDPTHDIATEQKIDDSLSYNKAMLNISIQDKVKSDREKATLMQKISKLKQQNKNIQDAQSKIDNSNDDIDDVIDRLNRTSRYLIQQGYR